MSWHEQDQKADDYRVMQWFLARYPVCVGDEPAFIFRKIDIASAPNDVTFEVRNYNQYRPWDFNWPKRRRCINERVSS